VINIIKLTNSKVTNDAPLFANWLYRFTCSLAHSPLLRPSSSSFMCTCLLPRLRIYTKSAWPAWHRSTFGLINH